MRRQIALCVFTLGAALVLPATRTAAQSNEPEHHRHRSQTLAKQAPASQTIAERTESFKFVTIDVPNATFTIPAGIGPSGDIVGIYGDASFNEHGFLLSHGNFTTIDVPGALIGASGILRLQP